MIKSIYIVGGVFALLCSDAYCVERSKNNDDKFDKVIVLDGGKQGVYKEHVMSQEEKQAKLHEKTKKIESLWKKIPVQKSALRSCDAMPTTIPFDAVFEGIPYKIDMTQYNDREFGEMSDIADFEVSLEGSHVGTFYSLSKTEAFKVIYGDPLEKKQGDMDKKSFFIPNPSEKKRINWEIFGIERCSLLKCMGRPY